MLITIELSVNWEIKVSGESLIRSGPLKSRVCISVSSYLYLAIQVVLVHPI